MGRIDVAEWVLAAERAYVAAATRANNDATTPTPTRGARAIAAAGAIASHHLAVAAPLSFGIIIDVTTDVAAAALTLVAHRTWFAPRDIRCAAIGRSADELADLTDGREVTVDEALACDIVNVCGPYARVMPPQLRRGTHLNVIWEGVLAPELHQLATVFHESQLPALAAGLIGGRQLDEITIFVLAAPATKSS